jgi:hypothetical protein
MAHQPIALNLFHAWLGTYIHRRPVRRPGPCVSSWSGQRLLDIQVNMGHGRAHWKFLRPRPLISNPPDFEDQEGEEWVFYFACHTKAWNTAGDGRHLDGKGNQRHIHPPPPLLLHARAAFLELPGGYTLRQTGLLAFITVLGRSSGDPEGPLLYLKCTFGIKYALFTSLADSLTPPHLYFHLNSLNQIFTQRCCCCPRNISLVPRPTLIPSLP